MNDKTCPNCGRQLPAEMGQHSDNLITGAVTCPYCGVEVTLRPEAEMAPGVEFEHASAAPPGRTEGTESFSGADTMPELADDLEHEPT